MPSGQPAGCRRYKAVGTRESPHRYCGELEVSKDLAEDRRLTTEDCFCLPTLLQISQNLLGDFFQGLEDSRALESHRFDHRFVLATQLF